MTPETKLRTAACRHLERLRKAGLAVKWLKIPVGMGIEVGTPDMLIVLEGRAYFVELKAGSNQPTEIQRHRLRQWTDAGATCGVARSVDDVLAILGL